jgi:hypothetical protein
MDTGLASDTILSQSPLSGLSAQVSTEAGELHVPTPSILGHFVGALGYG